MIRFQVQITIGVTEDQLTYAGRKLDEPELVRLLMDLIYGHTQAYESDIEVSVMRLYDKADT